MGFIAELRKYSREQNQNGDRKGEQRPEERVETVLRQKMRVRPIRSRPNSRAAAAAFGEDDQNTTPQPSRSAVLRNGDPDQPARR
jgi:hypothetical protein